jgi:hypothetical protein
MLQVYSIATNSDTIQPTKELDYSSENLDVEADGRILLKWILKKWGGWI